MTVSWHRLSTLVRAWTDAVAYAVFHAVGAAFGAVALGVATGGGFVRGKVFAFVAGLAVIGYATVRLWPTSIEDLDGSTIRARGTRFEEVVRSLPPVRWIRLPRPPDRVRVATKLFLAGVGVLAASLFMEVGLGIA